MACGRLTVLLDRDDLAGVEAGGPEPLSGTLLVFDVDLHVHLLDRGIDHLTCWDVVGHGELEALRAFDEAVWQTWQRHACAPYDGIDCLKMARYRHRCCFSRLAWVAFVVRKALHVLSAREVVLFEESGGHGLDQPADYRKMPLLFALARGMAEAAGIPVRLLRRDPASAFADRVAQAAGRRFDPVDVAAALGAEPYVLFVGSGEDLVRQLPLIRELRDRNGFHVVQLYKSADQHTLDRLRRPGHLVWHEWQVAPEPLMAADRSWALPARRAFEGWRDTVPADQQCIFANRHLDMHFDFIFGAYLERMAGHVRTWKRFLAEHPPSLLIANHAVPILDVADHLGVPSLMLAHGTMMLGHRGLFECASASSFIGAVSGPHKDRLLELGLDPARILETGDPGLDPLLREARPAVSARRAEGSGAPARPRSERPRVLVCTSAVGLPMMAADLPRADWKGAVRDFEALGRLAGRRPGWDFIVKCHPRYDHPALYEYVNRRLPPDRRMQITSDLPLARLVPSADAVVFPNIISAALIEASLWAKPVFLLTRALVWLDQRVWGIEGWPRVESVDELERELATVFRDPRACAGRVAQTQEGLRHFFGGEPQPSAPRCADLIEDLVSTLQRS